MGNPENYPKKHLKTDLYLRNKKKEISNNKLKKRDDEEKTEWTDASIKTIHCS